MALSTEFLLWGSSGPANKGLRLSIRRETIWSTGNKASAANAESRSSFQTAPRFRWDLDYEFLSQAEAAWLDTFFSSARGSLIAFPMTDPFSKAVMLVRFASDSLVLQHLAMAGRDGTWPARWTCTVGLISVLDEE